ncbi:MAG TPA: DeoR/GlpR family DNA-binding transcription regulator [Planctomycetota bacterium]|nr:DeoR/GlpR family DNA-binding transcription regulator [Planctomycetota bacterium]
MLVAERHREILNILQRDGSVRVTELAKNFQVAEETIRRDLERLEVEGRLHRSHGGAVPVNPNGRDIPYTEREMRQQAEKKAIGQAAALKVKEGDTIFIDASSTALAFARALPDIHMTVLTNALKVALELASRPHIRVIGTGGLFTPESLSFLGPLAEKIMGDYHVEKLFFSCKGVDLERGITESNEMQGALKQKLLSISNERYLLADSSKFGVRGLTRFADFSDLTELITDKKAPQSLAQQIAARGVKVTLA